MAPYASGSPKVAVWGDSITVLGEPDLTAALPARYGLGVGAVIGAGSATWLPYARATEPEPDCVVIALGTNDANVGGANYRNPVQYAANIGALFGACDRSPNPTDLVVVNLSPGPWTGQPGYDPDPYNAWLAQIPGCALVDWHAVTTANPSLLSDGVHTTPAGALVWATLIADAIQSVTP